MRVSFRTKKLERQYLSSKEAVKAYGDQVASKFIERVNIIKAAESIDDLVRLPGLNCHQLQGDLSGKWAIKLTGRYRLIFRLQENVDVVVQVVEVSNHYGD